MAVAADIRLGLPLQVALDMKQLEAFPCALGQFVVKRSALRGRVSYIEQKLRHVITFALRQQTSFAFVIFCGVAIHRHRRGETTINQMPRRAFGHIGAAVWFHALENVGAVVAAVGIAGDAVPMEGRGVAQAAHGHGGARHDLRAARDNRRFQNPKQLVGVSIGMTTGAGKSRSGGRGSGVKRNAPAFEGGVRGVVQCDGRLHLELRGIGYIDQRNGVGHGIEHPRCSVAQRDAPRDCADVCAAENFSGGGIDGQELVRAGGGDKQCGVVRANLNGKWRGERFALFWMAWR